MDEHLADIFKNKRAPTGQSSAVDWDERRDKYLEAVNGLYSQIETFLKEPIQNKLATLHRRPKELSENYIGTYKVDDLVLTVGDEQIRFSPRGRNIVGASGRIDVLGERGEEVLIAQVDGRWSLVESRQPSLKVIPFGESSLATALTRVMRG